MEDGGFRASGLTHHLSFYPPLLGSESPSCVPNRGPGSPLTWVVGRGVTGQHHSPTFVGFHWVSFLLGEFLQNWSEDQAALRHQPPSLGPVPSSASKGSSQLPFLNAFLSPLQSSPRMSWLPTGLTAKAQDSLPADHGAHWVGGQALIDAGVLCLGGVHDDQVASHQLAVGTWLQLHLGAIHLPSAAEDGEGPPESCPATGRM